MIPRSTGKRIGPRRRGVSLYIVTLATTLLVSMLGVSGLLVIQVQNQQLSNGTELLAARTNARAALELALSRINADPDWRTTYVSGVETTPQSLGADATGTLSWIIEDIDGSLAAPDTDLRLKGVGRVNNTIQVMSVKISGTQEMLDSLKCSTYAVGDVDQSSSSTTNAGPFASGSTFTANGSITGDVEGNPVVGSGSISGTVTDPGPDRTMPSPSVWDTYLALATTIPFADISQGRIKRELISGNVNPYGPSTNPDGIYHIQIPDGETLDCENSRLHCTLLIELIGSASCVVGPSVLWDPFNGNNYPAAIVKGNGSGMFRLAQSNAPLKELPGTNFNPPSDPYDGVSNTLEIDTFTPLVRGFIHTIGASVHTTLASTTHIFGVVVAEGTMTLGANIDITRNPDIIDNPPFGYSVSTGDMNAEMGTWLWEAAP